MSQRGVEVVLGRLATDAAWRQRFQDAAVLALKELTDEGIELSRVEVAALARLPGVALEHFADAIDPRLQRAVLPRPACARRGNRRD